MGSYLSVPTLVGLAAALTFAIYRVTRNPLHFLQGPKAKSWLLGYEYALLNQEELGTMDYAWSKQYGTIYKRPGCFSENVVMVSDPLGLQHVLHTSGYRYPREKAFHQSLTKLFGRGILWAEGDRHARHRKALSPSFSWTQSKLCLPVFQRVTDHMCNIWAKELEGTDGKVMDVHHWLSRLALDVIGEAAFGFHFGALDGKSHEFTHLCETTFADTKMPSEWTLLYRVIKRTFPNIFEAYSDRFPTKEEQRFANFRRDSKKIARNLLENKIAEGVDDEQKDILNVLAQAYDAKDQRRSLDEDEVLCQITTLTLAGHDTSSGSLTWHFWELAKHPEDQERVYQEMRELRARNPGTLTASDYDSMPFFNAVMKESLRLNPMSPNLARYVDCDDVIPLSQPVVSTSGKTMHEVKVPAGTRVNISIGAYNRLPEVWGEDADQWNPRRFLDIKRDTDLALGVYSNLLTFSAGVKSCIGWRFALLEMQAIIFRLLEQYEFFLPPEGLEIQRAMGIVMIPLVKGKAHEGPKMPLMVRPRQVQSP